MEFGTDVKGRRKKILPRAQRKCGDFFDCSFALDRRGKRNFLCFFDWNKKIMPIFVYTNKYTYNILKYENYNNKRNESGCKNLLRACRERKGSR